MTRDTLIKGIIQWSGLQFRGQSIIITAQHDHVHADVVLKRELRVLHPVQATGSGLRPLGMA